MTGIYGLPMFRALSRVHIRGAGGGVLPVHRFEPETGSKDQKSPIMADEDPKAPPCLTELDARLRKARGEAEEKKGGPDGGQGMPASMVGLAMRMGVELVVGVVVGAGIGWFLDSQLGTGPWLLIVFFFLGAAAGMMNVYRAMSGQGYAVGFRRPENGPDGDDRDGTQ